jgi:hypothetical protein
MILVDIEFDFGLIQYCESLTGKPRKLPRFLEAASRKHKSNNAIVHSKHGSCRAEIETYNQNRNQKVPSRSPISPRLTAASHNLPHRSFPVHLEYTNFMFSDSRQDSAILSERPFRSFP